MANEDKAYLVWVRSQRCALRGPDCSGHIEAHHTGRKGTSQRTHDHFAIALCWRHHHVGRHGCWIEPFKSWSKQERKEWEALEVHKHRTRYLAGCDALGVM